jgi:hypothetical protein
VAWGEEKKKNSTDKKITSNSAFLRHLNHNEKTPNLFLFDLSTALTPISFHGFFFSFSTFFHYSSHHPFLLETFRTSNQDPAWLPHT